MIAAARLAWHRSAASVSNRLSFGVDRLVGIDSPGRACNILSVTWLLSRFRDASRHTPLCRYVTRVDAPAAPISSRSPPPRLRVSRESPEILPCDRLWLVVAGLRYASYTPLVVTIDGRVAPRPARRIAGDNCSLIVSDVGESPSSSRPRLTCRRKSDK